MSRALKPVTESYLAFIADLTAEDVLRVNNLGGVTPDSRAEYREISLARRLAWCHGVAGAVERLNADLMAQ